MQKIKTFFNFYVNFFNFVQFGKVKGFSAAGQ